MLGERHGGQNLIAILLLPHRPRGDAVDASRGHLRLAHEKIGTSRRRLTKGDFNGRRSLATGHATDVDGQLAVGAGRHGHAIQGVHGHARRFENGTRVLTGARGDLACGAVDRDRDVTRTRHERGQLVARRGAVRREGDSRAQRCRVGKDAVRGGGSGPQGASLAIDGHRVGLGGAHNDRVAVTHGLARAGLHEVVAADAHTGNLEGIADGVAPRCHGAGYSVDLEHDGGVRGGDADTGDAEDARRRQGSNTQNDARRGGKGAQTATEDVQGAGGGRTQGGAQMMAHNSPLTR